MSRNYYFLLFALAFVFQSNGQTPGVSTFYEQFSGDTREYIEYIPGNLPIIISAPHGGVKQSGSTIGGTSYPDNDSTLPDRSCGTNERDDNTDILIREIQAEIFGLTGCYAHVIINNLHRSKLDPNREQNEATCGDSDALDHWNAWHSFIDQASTSVETNFGKGLYIDLHGQSHTVPRIEIGYNITSGELNAGNLNSTTNIDRSTIKNLVSNNLNSHTHEELIRGDNSLGQLFQEQPAVFYNANVNPQCGVTSGYRAVPSNSTYGSNTCDDTRPFSNAYFDGNFYNNRRHGSGNGSGTSSGSNDGGGNVDGIMTEVNRRVRDLGTYNGNVYDTRPQTLVPFAKEYAAVVLDYIDIHYNDFAEFTYASNTFDVNDPDPSPTISGLSGGTFSTTPGLILNVNTGVIDISASSTGNYVVTYTVGSCGYYKETFNIQITVPDTQDPTAPTNLISSNITTNTVDLSWTASTDNVGVAGYDIYQDGVFIINVVGTTHLVTGLTASTNYSFYVIAKDAANNSSVQSNTISITTADIVNCSGTTISSFPYNEDFESTVNGGLGLWTQDTGDDGDWTRDSGGTPSGPTGPTGDFDPLDPTGQRPSGFYMYVEATLNSDPGPGSTVYLVSPCIDLTGFENGVFSFYYHMFGTDMGDLTLDVSTDNGMLWTTINTLSGQQHSAQTDPWLQRNVDLSAYNNQNIKLRFSGTTLPNPIGNTNGANAPFRSDMAIDYINITADVIISSDPPSAVCQNITVQLDNTGNAVIVATDVDGGSTDDMAITNYSIDINSFNCSNVGTPVDVNLTVTDAENQTDTCIATVTVVDEVAPEFVNSPSDINLNCGNNQPFWVNPSITDNCGGELIAIRTDGTGLNSGDVFPVGTTIISFSVTDTNGNSNTTSFNITIDADNQNPNAICQDLTVQLDNTGNATITAAQINNGSSDNCGIASISASQTIFTCADEGANDVTLTVTDTSGNIDTCIAVVTITLKDAPAIIECWETATYNNTTCVWELNGTQPTEPIATNCWDDYQFNNVLCEWENQGSEPTVPTGLTAVSITTTTATINWDTLPPLDFDLRYRQLGSPIWTDILDILTNTEALTSLTPLTQYEVEVRSKCSITGTSNYTTAITFITLDDTIDYCDSASTDVSDEFISRVQLNTIDNESGALFYSDFTSMSTVLRKGTEYTISITPTWTGTIYNEAYSVWIDYNGDGDFTDGDEQVFTQAPTQATPVSGNFTIPLSASNTKTRMRVSLKWNDIPDPCETFQYGEVEDYTIILVGSSDLIYTSSVWTPYAPSPSTNTDNAFVLDGTYTVTDDIQINDMTVCNGAGIVIEKVKSLTVNGKLKTSDNVILESDSNEYASLIVNDLVIGTAQYKRHVNATASTGGNDLIAPPVFGESFMDFRATNPNIVSNTGNTLFLFGPFDKVTDTYLLYSNTETAPMYAGTGYRAASTDGSTLTFTGLVNTRNVSIPIVNNGPTNPEWNLVGNPYPSYIRLFDFLAANSSQFDTQSAGIYGYDANGSNVWTIWNQAFLDANPNAVITPGQGFLVASATNNGRIDFTPAMRSIGNTDDFIQGRQDGSSSIVHLQLELSNATEGIYNTDFYFTNNASNGMDFNYDSSVFGDQAASDFALYSHLLEENQDIDMAIQSLGLDALSNAVIPLGVHIEQGQQITISISASTLPENVEVYLEDTVNNTFTLLNDSDYTITPTDDITSIGRYFLRFNEETLNTNSNDINRLEIYTTTDPKLLYVKGQLLEDTELTIYDIQGRIIKTMTLNINQTTHRIDVSSMTTGAYIATLKNDTQKKTQKVVIK
nr:GEVED domain-containing protein [uncultured Psychroserpens sp.]